MNDMPLLKKYILEEITLQPSRGMVGGRGALCGRDGGYDFDPNIGVPT